MALTTSVNVRIGATLTKTQDLITAGLSAPLAINETISFATGTATGLADLLWFDTRNLAASAADSHDLAGGSLTDVFGTAITFVKVKGIWVKAAATNNVANPIIVGNGTAPFIGPFGAAGASEQRLPPGGIYLAVHPTTGWTVTATTGDILKVTNGAGTNAVDYDIVVWGTSA
jgi:hypothetical protein